LDVRYINDRTDLKNSTKSQIKTGFRLGGGIGALILGGTILSYARIRYNYLVDQKHSPFVDWLFLLELSSAVALMLSTAQVWVRLVAGLLVFGILKGIILVLTGKDLLPAQQFTYSPLDGVIVIVYCLVALMLVVRFSTESLEITDRIALTSFLLCLIPSGSKFPSSWAICGLVALFAAWALNSRRDSS
jgi:hypothetical protein